MRAPRQGLAWSKGRVQRRGHYATYIASPAWRERRERWYTEWTTLKGAEPTCLGCGIAWSLRHGDLHHRTYDRLGHEAFTDLVPLCRDCHTRLHDLWDSSSAWRRMGRPAATAGIIGALRRLHNRRHQQGATP